MEDFILDVAVKVLGTLAISYFLVKAFLQTRNLIADTRNHTRKNADDEHD